MGECKQCRREYPNHKLDCSNRGVTADIHNRTNAFRMVSGRPSHYETIRVYGITFVRAPAHENHTGRWDMAEYHKGQVLSIRLDTRGKRTECTISVGAANDVARLREFKLKLIGRSRRSALIEALDIARYPLQLAGFGELELQKLRVRGR